MKNGIEEAEADFQKAIKNPRGVSNQKRQLLPKLNKAISDVKTNRNAAENAEYANANRALTHAKNNFSIAIPKSENVLEEITTSNPFI